MSLAHGWPNDELGQSLPTACSREYPKTRSAAGLNSRTFPVHPW